MPSSILIFGGSGKVAQHLTRLLVAANHTVHSLIRSPAQADNLAALGAHPIVQDLESASVSALADTIRTARADTIIWAAGAGGGSPERTRTVDHEGAVKSMDATAQAGVKRYLIISAVDVRDREAKPQPEWYNDDDRDRSDKVWSAIGTYMAAKLAADRDLVRENGRRGLEYTIVRPGGLSQDAATGNVAAGQVHLGRTIARADVAAFVVECLGNEGTKGMAIDVVGGETGIAEAVERVVAGKVDTFAGRF
nr:upf0659 protein [Quercus suber]